MELSIDRERCIGAGMCVLIASDVFDQDMVDGRVVSLGRPVTHEQVSAVREAAQVCPSGALAILSGI